MGLNLALAADFTIAATDAQFWSPFVGRGFTPDSGGSWLLQRRIGAVKAREMAELGRVVSGTEAAEWQMIHRAIAPERLLAAADELVTALVGTATVASGLAKWLMQVGTTAPLDQHLRHEAFAMEVSSCSEDCREGLAAFDEGRPPRYNGR
jgi:2-(1,2-epoxy-1,2-dihydrophenyl)acetyl-CoA isomerase